MKKLYRTLTVITLLSIILSSFLFFPDISFAENNPPQFFSNAPKEIPVLNARHAVVLDNTTGRILFEKDAYTKTAMASTTKLMTALIVAENIDISAIVKVSAKAASTGGSTIDLHQGEEITVLDLLYGLMLRSGNDAAVALSEAVAGSVESFCTLMNCKAKALGAYNTHFTSPHGLDSHEHYTTAYDLALICRAASQNSIVNKIMGTKHYETPRRFLINTNPFLGVTPEVTGGKTGFTNNAGRCIALTASKNNLDITIILIGCSDSKGRVSDGNKIINYIYSSYTMYNIVSGNTAIATLGNSKSRTRKC